MIYKFQYFGLQYNSTMQGKSYKDSLKQKKIVKKERKSKKIDELEEQGEDFNIQQQLQQQKAYVSSPKIQNYQSPDQVRNRLAKDALSKLNRNKKSSFNDDFFLLQEGKEEAKKQQVYNEQVAQKLKEDYLRKQNKLFQSISEQYALNEFLEPIQYKGHTLCITAFQMTNENIYSCSKDKSIIKWDRETKKKQFFSLGKDKKHHLSDILSLSLHSNETVLATAGDDCQIKLWDTRSCELIDTLRGHKNAINGLKFGINSNNLCSVSADLSLKQWDFAQRGLIQTFYEHNGQILDIDAFNGNDFISSGNDHQVITWKTEKETKVVFKGHDYAIDRVRAINLERFITACQDGSVYLWNTKKIKPVFKFPSAHKKGWISALDNLKQTNIFATAGVDHVIKIWGIQEECKGLKLIKQLPIDGIATDLKMNEKFIAVAECDQLRMGRWITDKCRNKIKIFPIKRSE